MSSVDVSIHDLRRIVVHRNNRHYAFALLLCEKILAMLMPDERGDSGRFRDFTRDHGAMARLFEKFVRNFYDHHRGRCGLTSVASQRIDWANTAHEAEATRWPGMLADVCIRRKVGSPLVIDCKFYHDVLKETSQGKEVLSSANLYQIFSYTQNLRTLPGWEHTDGMLLYAENGTSVDEEQVVLGTRLRVVTLNLNQPWNEIEARLLKLVQHRQILRAGA